MEPKIHPTEIPGYEGSIESLAVHIHALRYDILEQFYRVAAIEINRQATADDARGRPHLARMLREAVTLTLLQQQKFEEIFLWCRPYMQHEISGKK